MTIDKNQIGKSGSDRFQYAASYRRRFLQPRSILDRGMVAVNKRSRTGVEADYMLSKIFRSFSKVLEHQLIDVQTSAPEQADNVSCSVVLRFMNFPIPIQFFQMIADSLQLFARDFLRESDQPLKYLHLAHYVTNNCNCIYFPSLQLPRPRHQPINRKTGLNGISTPNAFTPRQPL